MAAKPSLGILPIAKKNQYQGDLNKFIEYANDYYKKDESCQTIIHPKILFDEDELVQAVNDMERTGADLLLFVVGSWIYSSLIIAAVNDLHTPFILFGLSDRIANGNLGASIQIKYVLREIGKNFRYMAGKIDNAANYEKIRQYLKAAWVKKYLRNRKIATIGGKCMMMYQTQVNEFDWKRVFGVDFQQYDSVQVFTEMDKVDPAEAKKVAENFLAKVDKVNWSLDTGERIYDDAIESQAKMYLAFKRMKELYNIDLFANKCIPEMVSKPYGYNYAACVATCLLNEDGIITACEADVPAGLSMYILSLLSREKVFFADIAKLNAEKKLLTFFNCGTAPISMADKKRGISLWPIPRLVADEAVPYEYFTAEMGGACVHFDLENDKTITLFRIGGNGESLRFHAARAITTDREVGPGEEQGTRWPGFGILLKNDPDSFLQNATGHHYSIVYGDYIDELGCLAEIYGIDFILDE